MTAPNYKALLADYEAEKAATAHMGLVIPGPASDAIRAAGCAAVTDLIRLREGIKFFADSVATLEHGKTLDPGSVEKTLRALLDGATTPTTNHTQEDK